MASISSSHNLSFPNTKIPSHPYLKRPNYPSSSSPPFLSRLSDSALCRCHHDSTSSSSSDNWRWDSLLKSAIKSFDSFFNPRPNDLLRDVGIAAAAAADDDEEKRREEEEDWNWDRWRKYFDEIDSQERLVSILKSQLGRAVFTEDYEDAARLKVAIAAAATNDTVGRVIAHLNKAVVEERFQDAAYIRDNAGAGLVGWWAGISKDINDPLGLIIRITPEHGRYVARSYSPRQLATATAGVPLFEVFLRVNKRGEYKEQAVFLNRRGVFQDSPTVRSKALDATGNLNPLDSTEDKSDLIVVNTEDPEDGDDRDDSSDLAEGLSGFQNILRDMIPGVKVKVLKVTAPGKVDRDLISKVIEQIEKNITQHDSGGKEQASVDKSAKRRVQRSIDHVMFDLSKFIGREKIPLKVLKDVGELINLTLIQAQNYQSLSGSTTFNRIEIPTSSDPLNGLYIGAHGLYTSEVIHLRRKFGQWQEDGGKKEPSDLEFYEYVEAVKLTGDPYVPAGKVIS
ncbi:protein EXECUTER 1, chloroplastic [Quercus suber]|uniref:protein EXECUTER 1, chloroplastic n=1 Tax=Quercus suber TaxID=58331 RepID=UPI0032DEE1F0